jgi:hypothetical protein
MHPFTSRAAARTGLAVTVAAFGLAASSTAQTDAAPLARLGFVEKGVQQGAAGSGWSAAVEGGRFDIGDGLRTGPEGLARLELPWMVLSLSPDSDVVFPDEYVLSIVLEKGRTVLEATAHPALKLETAEAEVRGTGRAVVRREAGRTLVTCLDGRFRVSGSGRAVSLSPGQGTVVTAGRAPSAAEDAPFPPGAEGLWPGQDPVYTEPGEALELQWEPAAPAFQIEVLPVGSETVLLQRDVGPPPARLALPWSGAFRWRVASRDDRGLEGPPSSEGLICVDIVE